MLATAFRHRVWRYEESLRSALGHDEMGFSRRPTPTASMALVRPRQRDSGSAQPASPSTLRAGLIGRNERSALAVAAAHFGVELHAADSAAASVTVAVATRERWPLLAVSARPGTINGSSDLEAYLRTGGTLSISELTAADDDWLQSIGQMIGVTLPRCRTLVSPATHLTFSAARPDLTAELAGLRIDNDEGTWFLESAPNAEPLAWLESDGDSLAAVVEIPACGGRLVLGVGPRPPSGRLGDLFGPEHALSLLPTMMLVRRAYGLATWWRPIAMANFTIDDPALRQGLLGLDYPRALAASCQDNFHLTVATIPRELSLAEPKTIRLLAENHTRLSACYHGNDHHGYEFFASDNERTRFRNRTIRQQQAGAMQAVARGRAFAAKTGHAIDRVMVFPHGVGAAVLLGELGRLGFLASANWIDRYPLGFAPPTDPLLGMRPADIAWGGFPLLWRRGIDDQTFAFDLFAGRPALFFTHRQRAGANFEPLREVAARVNQVGNGEVRWRGLEEIARHAYVQRRRPGAQEWDVLMTSNLACLHNTSDEPRRYRVLRPSLPDGTRLAAAGTAVLAESIDVEVAPGQTAMVAVEVIGAGELPNPCAGLPCSLLTADPA